MARAPVAVEAESIPETDRLDGFPHPRETAVLFGQAEAEKELLSAFRSVRLHHAWLIAGPEGIGKATLAYRIARFLLAGPRERTAPDASLDVAPDSAAFRQVRALSHPGLLVMRRPWNTQRRQPAAFIPVDDVRRLRSFLGYTADEDAWRVVIVDTTDDLNPSAANALLKSLEEPPSRTVFLLLTSQVGSLLPTIRSRCRILQLHPLGAADLRRAASTAIAASGDAAVEPQLADHLIELAEGRVRRLLVLSAAGGLKLHERIEAILAGLPNVDWQSAHTLADELAATSAEQKFEIFFDLLLRRIAGEARRLGASGAVWAELWEWIVREKEQVLTLNLDRRMLILDAVSRLAALARS